LDIKCPFKIDGDRLLLLSNKVQLIVCFHLPKAAETFIKGLFMSQQIDIADRKSKASFIVEQVESLGSPLDIFQKDETAELLLKPLSPVVCGLKSDNGHYTFLSPEDTRFEECFLKTGKKNANPFMKEKKITDFMADELIQVLFFKNPPKSRLITIKAGTAAETKIRGFINFEIN
jgi:CRISPR-associated endoribonuclease Cas6